MSMEHHQLLRNLAIKNNSANRGGGVYANSSSLIVENCIFSDNEAVDYGGAFHSHGGSPTIKNSIIHNNTHTGSSWNGGGLSFSLVAMHLLSIVPLRVIRMKYHHMVLLFSVFLVM